mgnify:CR=1 FL=1
MNKNGGLSTIAKLTIALAGLFVISMFLFVLSLRIYIMSNVTGNRQYLYIHTGATFDEVLATIKQEGIVRDTTAFIKLAKRMSYPDKVKPGRYRLKKGMSNRRFINMLKSGTQQPVDLSFQGIRLKEDFAGVVAQQIEADSLAIINLIDSSAFIEQYGFNKHTIYAMFIPNSYELYWNTLAPKFFARMYDEYQKFWNKARRDKAEYIGLSPIQVSIMASIVCSEARYDKEMPMIAGLYMNRYKKGIALEADPTVIFANNDFSIRRVLNRHLKVDSPYNTYMYAGLPPGPITMPSINAIDAVLNYTKHDYIYMCAKEDFSGYHNFASTLEQHQANARKFQRALDERNIMK